MSRNVQSLFIHSTGTGPALWANVPFADALCPANIGYAPNPLLQRGDVCLAEDEVAHLRKQLPPGPVHIYAHSYGGLIGLKLARELGADVKSLFMYEPVLFGALTRDKDISADAAAEVQSFLDNPWFLTDEENAGKALWLERFIDYWNRKGAWMFMTEQSKQAQLQLGWKMFQEVRAVFNDTWSFADYAFDVPMTLIHGQRTTAASKAMMAAMAKVNPHARVVELPRAGHMGPLLNPDAVHEQMLLHAQAV